MGDMWLPILLVIVLLVASLMFVVISKGRRTTKLDVEKYRCKWLEIENQLDSHNADSFHLCVMRADSLLDEVMKAKGIAGETMGEKLKISNNKFSNINSIWEAHKLRNRLAHETDYKIDYRTARQALNSFKHGLKDLGAI